MTIKRRYWSNEEYNKLNVRCDINKCKIGSLACGGCSFFDGKEHKKENGRSKGVVFCKAHKIGNGDIVER